MRREPVAPMKRAQWGRITACLGEQMRTANQKIASSPFALDGLELKISSPTSPYCFQAVYITHIFGVTSLNLRTRRSSITRRQQMRLNIEFENLRLSRIGSTIFALIFSKSLRWKERATSTSSEILHVGHSQIKLCRNLFDKWSL